MAEKIDTTHVLLDRELVLYRREHSSIWQCRYKIDGVWQRGTTKQTDIREAKRTAREMLMEAEIRRRANLPVVTRNFRHIAKLAIDTMRLETEAGKGKVSYADYKRVIEDVLTPFFGKYSITSITYAVLEEFNAWRIEKMGKAPAHSTLLTQNAAMNRVFDEAVKRGFLTESSKLKLSKKGKESSRRPAFDLHEVQAMLSYFDAWIAKGRNEKSIELRELLRDYVKVLLDTGARPGKELMQLKWKQIKYSTDPRYKSTGKMIEDESAPWDEAQEEITFDLNRSLQIVVTGKTGTRTIVAMDPTVKALAQIARRNYGYKNNALNPLKEVVSERGDDFVFRTKSKQEPTSFQNLFESFLDEHELLIDPHTEKIRVFYSLRHTYATLALTHDEVPVHTLAKQMGTSVGMIEKHYSHLDVIKAIEQLRNYETRKLIAAGSVLAHKFTPKAKRGRKAKG